MFSQLYSSRSWLECIFIIWNFLTWPKWKIPDVTLHDLWHFYCKKKTDLWCLHDCGLLSLTVGSVLDDAMLNANQIYLLLLDICVSTNALEWWHDRLYTLEHFINSCIHSNTASHSALFYKMLSKEKKTTSLLTDYSVSGLSAKNPHLVRICLTT